MPDWLSVLFGTVVGGSFALLGTWLNGRQQFRALAAQSEHQRRLAAEEHSRRQSVRENERLLPRIEEQLRQGRTLAMAMSFLRGKSPRGATIQEVRVWREEARKCAGIKPDTPPPYADFLGEGEVEDEVLLDLLKRHQSLTLNFDVLLIDCDTSVDEIPKWPEIGELDELARRIGARYRAIQVEGRRI